MLFLFVIFVLHALIPSSSLPKPCQSHPHLDEEKIKAHPGGHLLLKNVCIDIQVATGKGYEAVVLLIAGL
jgi:hypothetical protein